jgi:hypothetical protein
MTDKAINPLRRRMIEDMTSVSSGKIHARTLGQADLTDAIRRPESHCGSSITHNFLADSCLTVLPHSPSVGVSIMPKMHSYLPSNVTRTTFGRG